MPLRVLLLLPDGEQPTVSAHPNLPKSPSSASFKTILNGGGGVPARPRLSNNGEYNTKPLPSPPIDNRASSQTHLTLPSTSGSSAGSSQEYAPSPPLSPSPTSSPSSPFRSVYDDADTVQSVRGLKLSKKKGGKPRLVINTRLPKIGKGVRYRASGSGASQNQDHGEATARRAVDARLQHLLATTGQSAMEMTLPSEDAAAPVHVASQYGSQAATTSPQLVLPKQTQPISTIAKGRGPHFPHQYDPPSPPTSGIAPYRIFGAHEEVPVDVVSDPTRAKRVPVKVGWSRTGVLIRSSRTRPKGTKGRYIRLVTASSLPSLKVEEEDEPITSKLRGRMPTVLIDDEEATEDQEEDENLKEKPTSNDIPTVYMTELVAAQYDRPVPCMMYPVPASLTQSTTASRRLSTLSTISTHSTTILNAPPKAYQLPLPIMTTLQKTALSSARMLVYAVPPGYAGAIPPPECVNVGEEVVPPWVSAAAQLPVLNTAHGQSVSSPRGSMLGLTAMSPRGSLLNPGRASGGWNTLNTGAAATGPSGTLSPRWPVEGLWSRARGGADAQRNSVASALGVESPVPSRPMSLLPVEKAASTAEGHNDSTAATATSSWVSSLSSIRAKAQVYYAKDKESTSPLPSNHSLPTSKSDVLPTTGGSSNDPTSTAAISSSLSTSSASRTFGSLFLRTPSSTSTSGGDSSSTGGALSPSGEVTPSTAGLQTPGFSSLGASTLGKGEVLFEFTEPPRDGEVVKVEIVEAAPPPPATTASRWKGWGARWGS